MILIIDNHDSFVYNIYRYFEELGAQTKVLSASTSSIEEIKSINPKALVISPGPCTPNEATLSMAAIKEFHQTLPILGVCLGHQCLGQFFGGTVAPAQKPLHGFSTIIENSGIGLFKNLPKSFLVGRYHSLIVQKTGILDENLTVDAISQDGEIMALSHRTLPLFGVQFHPESVLSQHGHSLLNNFLDYAQNT